MKPTLKFLPMRFLSMATILICPCCPAVGQESVQSRAVMYAAPSVLTTDTSFFPIMSWESAPKTFHDFQDPKHGLSSLSECGFTIAAFTMPSLLPTCEQLGLKAIVGEERADKKWKDLSDDEIVSTVKHLVDASHDSPAVLGYLLEDEPGAAEFPALGKAVAAVRKLAPGKIAYVTLYPSYAIIGAKDISRLGTSTYEEYLERYVNEVKPQFISYDNYRVQYSNDLKDPKLAENYYTNLLTVRRIAQKYGLPFWNIVSGNQIRKQTPIPSPANLLFQAYTTLAAGGKGISWFTYYVHAYGYAPIDKDGNRTMLWSYLKMVNEQLKVIGPVMLKLNNTGVYFTAPAPVDSLTTLPGQLVENVTADVPLMIGEFSGDGNGKYAMIVNLSLEKSTKFTIQAKPNFHEIRCVSPVDGSLMGIEADNSYRIAAGQGALLKLQ